MCDRNEMGRYPSCVSAVFDGVGAEEHGMCGECSAAAKKIYDDHIEIFKMIRKMIEIGEINLNALECLID